MYTYITLHGTLSGHPDPNPNPKPKPNPNPKPNPKPNPNPNVYLMTHFFTPNVPPMTPLVK